MKIIKFVHSIPQSISTYLISTVVAAHHDINKTVDSVWPTESDLENELEVKR